MNANQGKKDESVKKDFNSVPWYFQPKSHRLAARTCPAIWKGVNDLMEKYPDLSESDAINYLMAKGLGLKAQLPV